MKVLHLEITICSQCPFSATYAFHSEIENGIYCTISDKANNSIRLFAKESYYKQIAKGMRGIGKALPPDFCPLPNKEIDNA